MVIKYSSALVIVLLGILLPLHAMAAIVVTWDCNTEADMANYRVEYSRDNGSSWGVEANVDHMPGCKTQELRITRYIAPGKKLYRLFAGDKSGNTSLPSQTAEFVQPISPIGNPGGQAEESLPLSPYRPDVVVPPPVPPAPTPTPPSPPPTPNPSAIASWSVEPGAEVGTLIVRLTPPDDGTGKPAEVNVRYQEGPSIGWGGAPSASCPAFPCTIGGLNGSTTYTLQAIPFRRIAGSGSAFGPFIGPATAKTNGATPGPVSPPPTPVPVPPPPTPQPPPPSTTLLGAIESGLDTCLTKKLAHTACMKALREAVRKVDR